VNATPENKTFKEAFAILQRNAETLRNQREPNVDDLLDIVQGSMAAYKVCTQRIDAVDAALKEVLDTGNAVP
jgi:exodeoxyribonuclease VII small subunit